MPLFKKILLLISVIAVAGLLVLNFGIKKVDLNLNISQTPVKILVAELPVKQAAFGLPVRVRIPGIEVDAPFKYVGITSEGAMDMPKNLDEIAWYKLGHRPGEIGSAVIAGHYGITKNGQVAAFENLSKIIKGDKIYIEDDSGATISFIVREIRSYLPTADTKDVFSSSDGIAHLNLITCEGVWDNSSKSYSGRLVIFAVKE